MADEITFDDKDKDLPSSDPRKKFRDVDANEVKDVINANAAELESVGSSVTALTAGAPAPMDTFAEVAAAINNDPNFYTTLVALINAKVVDNLTASSSVAPSKNAVNSALALKTAFLSFAKRVALTGTQNGVNNTFGIPQPIVLDSEEFFRNGSLQVTPGDYTISGQNITTVIPPESWETLRVNYIRP